MKLVKGGRPIRIVIEDEAQAMQVLSHLIDLKDYCRGNYMFQSHLSLKDVLSWVECIIDIVDPKGVLRDEYASQ